MFKDSVRTAKETQHFTITKTSCSNISFLRRSVPRSYLMTEDRDQWRALVNTVRKLRVPWRRGFLDQLQVIQEHIAPRSLFSYMETSHLADWRLWLCAWKLTAWVTFTLSERLARVLSSQGGKLTCAYLTAWHTSLSQVVPRHSPLLFQRRNLRTEHVFVAHSFTNLNIAVQSLWHKCRYCHCSVIMYKMSSGPLRIYYFARGPGFSTLSVKQTPRWRLAPLHCIPDTSSSNPSLESATLAEVFRCFPQSINANVGTVH
jgi:hypothetical protein